MSIMATAAINWAFRQHGLSPAEKFVLVTLADRANASEWSCFPSVRDLTERTGLHRTSVQRCLRKLEQLGHISTDSEMRGEGGYSSSTYKLNRPHESALGDAAHCSPPMQRDAAPHAAQCCPPSSVVHTPYIEEPSVEPSTNQTKRVSEKMCEEIYNTYPRRKGRGAALKAIRKAIKHIGFDALQTAVTTFATEWKAKLANGEDMKFCPWPQRWFNEQRYLDQEESATQSPVTAQATQPKKPQSVWELRTLRDTLQEDARQIRLRYCAEEAHYTSWDSESKRAEYTELVQQVKQLNKQLKAMAGGDADALNQPTPAPISTLVASVASKVKGGADE